MKKISLISVVTAFMFILSSCSTVTFMDDSWTKPGFTGQKYKKILVWAIAKNNLVKQATVEKQIVSNFRVQGINAIAATDYIKVTIQDLDKDGKIDNQEEIKKEVDKLIGELGIDAGLVVVLKDVKDGYRYVPGTTSWMPGPYYSGYNNYFWGSYDYMYSPGYMEKTKDVYLEANLYNVARDLVYSVQSETSDPTSLSDFAQSYGKALVNNLLDKGIIKK
ncbi:MAG: hypothetical protein NTV87_10440 [Ignavibacteriae bacterium]|nr:hypothetical protein [Ignavibacteriota bacterium]